MLLEQSWSSGESLHCIPCRINMHNDRQSHKRGSPKGTLELIIRWLISQSESMYEYCRVRVKFMDNRFL